MSTHEKSKKWDKKPGGFGGAKPSGENNKGQGQPGDKKKPFEGKIRVNKSRELHKRIAEKEATIKSLTDLIKNPPVSSSPNLSLLFYLIFPSSRLQSSHVISSALCLTFRPTYFLSQHRL